MTTAVMTAVTTQNTQNIFLKLPSKKERKKGWCKGLICLPAPEVSLRWCDRIELRPTVPTDYSGRAGETLPQTATTETKKQNKIKTQHTHSLTAAFSHQHAKCLDLSTD